MIRKYLSEKLQKVTHNYKICPKHALECEKISRGKCPTLQQVSSSRMATA